MSNAISATMHELCAELDFAEANAWDRIGGPTEAEMETIRALEGRIDDMRASDGTEALWRIQRLGRAVQNDWWPDRIERLLNGILMDALALNLRPAI